VPEKKFSALFIGPVGVGKTTLIKNLMDFPNPDATRPTIGAAINRLDNMTFFDWSGAIRYEHLTKSFYQENDAIIIILDDTLYESDALNYIQNCLDEIKTEFDNNPHPKLCLMINKKSEDETFLTFIDEVTTRYPNTFSIINYCSLRDKKHRPVLLKQIAKLCLLSHTEKLQKTNPSLFAKEMEARFLSREPSEAEESINTDINPINLRNFKS